LFHLLEEAMTQAQSMREEDRIVPFKEGNRLLGISKMTAYRHMRRANTTLPRPFFKGGRLFYHLQEIDGHYARQSSRAQVAPAGGAAVPTSTPIFG
jgi:predicted DNA-binding transcriptional regulator AlpA